MLEEKYSHKPVRVVYTGRSRVAYIGRLCLVQYRAINDKGVGCLIAVVIRSWLMSLLSQRCAVICTTCKCKGWWSALVWSSARIESIPCGECQWSDGSSPIIEVGRRDVQMAAM